MREAHSDAQPQHIRCERALNTMMPKRRNAFVTSAAEGTRALAAHALRFLARRVCDNCITHNSHAPSSTRGRA